MCWACGFFPSIAIDLSSETGSSRKQHLRSVGFRQTLESANTVFGSGIKPSSGPPIVKPRGSVVKLKAAHLSARSIRARKFRRISAPPNAIKCLIRKNSSDGYTNDRHGAPFSRVILPSVSFIRYYRRSELFRTYGTCCRSRPGRNSDKLLCVQCVLSRYVRMSSKR